jgi:hypothetical protein
MFKIGRYLGIEGKRHFTSNKIISLIRTKHKKYEAYNQFFISDSLRYCAVLVIPGL